MSFRDTEARIQTVCLIIICTIAVGLALFWLKTVVVPFVVAIFASMVLGPAIEFQTRHLKFPRTIALVATISLAFVLAATVGGLIASSVSEFASNAGDYEEQLSRIVQRANEMGILHKLGIDPDADINFFSLVPLGTLKGTVLGLTSGFTNLISKGFLIMLFTLFILAGSEAQQVNQDSLIEEIQASVKRYVVAKVLLSGATGVSVFAILSVLGVPFAGSFGAFAFLLNFIPSIGSIIATVLPLPILLFDPNISMTTMVLALALTGMVQMAIGNVIEPKLIGKSLDLHPITVLLALMFWGMIWGFDGMILSVPIMSVIKIIFDKTEMTAPLGHMLAGRLSQAWSHDSVSGGNR